MVNIGLMCIVFIYNKNWSKIIYIVFFYDCLICCSFWFVKVSVLLKEDVVCGLFVL